MVINSAACLVVAETSDKPVLQQCLDAMDERLARHDAFSNIDAMDPVSILKRFNEMDAKLKQFDEMETKLETFNKIEAKMKRFDAIEAKLEIQIEAKFKRLDEIEEKLKQLQDMEAKSKRFDAIDAKLARFDELKAKIVINEMRLNENVRTENTVRDRSAIFENKLSSLTKRVETCEKFVSVVNEENVISKVCICLIQ